jgi:CubicO group peptidase (beta-lactamase class C family)
MAAPSAWDWTTATPESQRLSGSRLESFWTDLRVRRTTALLVFRNDRIIFERYAEDYSRTRPHYTASMAKALVGGVSLAVALSDARISLDDAACKYVPQWREDPAKSKISIRQLGSHTSGLADAEADNLPHSQLTGWQGDFWKRLPPPNDPFTIARDKTPLLFAPGSGFQYSNPGMAMIAYSLTAALKDAPQHDLRTLLRDRVMRPIGVPDNEWSAGYAQTFNVDGLPLVPTWGGGGYSPGAVARLGRLMLRRGNWEGRRLVAPSAIAQVTADAGTPHNGAMGWWSNNDGTVAKLPRDAFWGAGAGHQVLLVVPSLNLIAVRNGEVLNPAKDYDSALRGHFFDPFMETIEASSSPRSGGAPYPPSPVIREIVWAPKGTIVRRAKGSDNWPMTWADDDRLYAAYGDGNGFEPFVSEKLSLGLARITGSAADFTGANVRSASLEQKGDGRAGKKASGLLMVDGILYLWARNASNSQLAWSSDHGATWTWGWKFTESFGCPVFLNFGMNNSGARDDFVYLYSPDSDNAYDPADRFVLARVPKARIRNRESYQFFTRLEADGRVVWTQDIGERGGVFAHPGNCWRSGVSYNAALKRYLWCQTLPASLHPQGPRFQGGLGVYDAPEPWGPWTTVFYAADWDVGPGESSSFPTKWMSADGRTVHLVFSGDDCFSVRKASLKLRTRVDSAGREGAF